MAKNSSTCRLWVAPVAASKNGRSPVSRRPRLLRSFIASNNGGGAQSTLIRATSRTPTQTMGSCSASGKNCSAAVLSHVFGHRRRCAISSMMSNKLVRSMADDRMYESMSVVVRRRAPSTRAIALPPSMKIVESMPAAAASSASSVRPSRIASLYRAWSCARQLRNIEDHPAPGEFDRHGDEIEVCFAVWIHMPCNSEWLRVTDPFWLRRADLAEPKVDKGCQHHVESSVSGWRRWRVAQHDTASSGLGRHVVVRLEELPKRPSLIVAVKRVGDRHGCFCDGSAPQRHRNEPVAGRSQERVERRNGDISGPGLNPSD